MGAARQAMGDKRCAQRPTMRRTRGASSSASPPREVLRAAIVCICSFVFLQIGTWKFPFMCKDSLEVRALHTIKQMRSHPYRNAHAGARGHVRTCALAGQEVRAWLAGVVFPVLECRVQLARRQNIRHIRMHKGARVSDPAHACMLDACIRVLM